MPCVHRALFAAFLVLLLPAAFALDAPVVTSSTHPEGEWANMPMEFRWGAVENAVKYCYALDSSPGAEAPDDECTTETSAFPPQKQDSGDYYFHVKAVSAPEASATTTYHIKLDIDSPSRPEVSAEAKEDGSIVLGWTKAEDPSSGVKEYEVYRKLMGNFDIRSTPIYATVSGSDTAFTDANELDQSTTYHYKLRAIDNAGNPGAVSNEVHAETAAKCDLDIDFVVELSADKKKLGLSISSSDTIYNGSLKAALPDGSTHVFFEDREPFGFWEEDFSLSGIEEGYIDFSLNAEEYITGDDCGQERRFIYDVTAPEAGFTFPKYNDRVSETVPLTAKIGDKGIFKSGLQSVTFFIREGESWTRLGSGAEADEGSYKFEWNTFSVENGQHRLRVLAVDMAGNEAEATQTLNVLNAFESALDLNAAIEKALLSRNEALVSKWAFAAKSIFSETADSLIEQADSNLSEAVRLSENPGIENETTAKLLLAQAILLYKQSGEVVSEAVYKEADFVFNKEQAGILLGAAGISGGAFQQALDYLEKASPERKLSILEVSDDNATYYRALIIVSYALDVNVLKDSNADDVVMQVIEVVPKEFAEYSSELDSNVSFTVLREDPSLSFALTRNEYRKRQLVYALKADLSQQQADALIEGNVINKFVAPPVLLPAESVVSGFGVSFELLLFVGVSLAAIVFVLVALLAWRRFRHVSRKRAGFSAPAEDKPLAPEKKPAAEKKRKGFPKLKIPALGGKKDESPLSVFGKK